MNGTSRPAFAVADLTGCNTTITTRFTGALRWGQNGKLQQRVEICEIEGNAIVNMRLEWRDVPTEPGP
jgi:hypothetical protein